MRAWNSCVKWVGPWLVLGAIACGQGAKPPAPGDADAASSNDAPHAPDDVRDVGAGGDEPAADTGAPTDALADSGAPTDSSADRGATTDAGADRAATTDAVVDRAPLPDAPPAVDGGALVQRVAFGSCNELTKSQGFWTHIIGHAPQVFLSLGDMPYLDYGDTYAQLAAVPGFQQLVAIAKPLAVWDDHDYGMDNGGAVFGGKVAAKKRFVDFWGPLGAIAADSPRRTREGNYDAIVMGPVGRQIQFIMLDVRYFKETAPTGSVLGAAQWQWLSDELRRPAELRLFMSGMAAVGSSASSDGWAQFPDEQQHLYDVIKASQAKGVVILSGDKHYAEISRRDVGLGYPLFDFTSSAFNAANSYAPQANQYRDLPASTSQNHNFGIVTVDWTAPGRPVVFQIFNAETGTLLMAKDLSLAMLGSP